VSRALKGGMTPAGVRIRLSGPEFFGQNGSNEISSQRFRDEGLHRELIGSVPETQVISRAFRGESTPTVRIVASATKTRRNTAADFGAKLRAPVTPAEPGLTSPGACPHVSLCPQPGIRPTTRRDSQLRWSRVVSQLRKMP
jgi:hypothetical protein